MADNTLSSWAPFLYELQGKVVEVFPSECPFLAEISGYDAHMGMVDHASAVQRISKEMDGGREIFSGKSVRHTLILAGLQAGSYVGEASTWNAPVALNDVQVNLNLVRALVPFSVSVDVERDSFDHSGASAVATLVQEARSALARLENFSFLGDGSGLIAAVTSASGSPGLTIPVGTSANFDYLLPGTVVDILTRSTGANPGNGKRRLIASVSESAGTITVDTNAQASDGDSGNVTFSANEGVYIPGLTNAGQATWPSAGNIVAQGLSQAAAASGTFQTLAKGSTPAWQGTDGRGGDTTVLPLSAQMLDGGVRRGRRAGLGKWDFAIGDPAAIDLYKQGLYAQVRYAPDVTTLKSGFSGIAYDGADAPMPVIKDPMAPKAIVRLVDKASMQLYGDQPGPAFLEDDGAMFRRFSRTLIKEAEMLDRVQLGFIKCNTIVSFANLAVAS